MKTARRTFTGAQVETIAAALRAMPPIEKAQQEFSQQEAIKMIRDEITSMLDRGYTHKEISEQLMISESASRSQLAHARARLRMMLSK